MENRSSVHCFVYRHCIKDNNYIEKRLIFLRELMTDWSVISSVDDSVFRKEGVCMDKRKIDLIESGMKLFAHKGYHKTSIQEIATDAGISKGAFYLYFNSKEEFIAIAIQYFHTQLTKEIINTSLEDSSPKNRFSKQINIISNYIYEHRDFIIMHFREDMSMGDNAVEIFQQMKIDH